MAKRTGPPSFDLHRALEALLFLASRPFSMRRIGDLLGTDAVAARAAVDAFRTTWNARGGGTVVLLADDHVQLMTAADLHEIAEAYVREETRSELTRPQLEALTVIAYRGPITKAELEQIRGVNCGLIIRNLLIRGLVTQRLDATRHEEVYEIALEFLRHLGHAEVRELPEYERLHGNAIIDEYLANLAGSPSPAQATAPPPAV